MECLLSPDWFFGMLESNVHDSTVQLVMDILTTLLRDPSSTFANIFRLPLVIACLICLLCLPDVFVFDLVYNVCWFGYRGTANSSHVLELLLESHVHVDKLYFDLFGLLFGRAYVQVIGINHVTLCSLVVLSVRVLMPIQTTHLTVSSISTSDVISCLLW
jgi:hypothetical protein